MINILSYLWHHKVGVIFFLILLFLIGTYSVLQIEKNMYPDKTLPQYNISAGFGNYSPEVIELKITAPIEREMSKLKYIKGVESRSRKGQANVTVYCDKNYNEYEFELLLFESIRQLRESLPQNAFINIARSKPDAFAGNRQRFLTYRIFSPFSLDSLSRLVENEIKLSISSIPGVSEVNINGLEKQAYFITIKEEFRNLNRFSINRISQSINEYFNVQHRGSSVKLKNDAFSIKFDENLISLKELKSIPIANLNGRVVKLGEISLVNIGPELKNSYIRFNGLDGISIDIKRRPEASAISTAEAVKLKIAELEKQYRLKTELLTDEGKDISKKLDDLFLRSFISLIVIFFITYSINKQLYNSIIVIVLLILSTLFSIFGLYITGNSINLYTMGGLALGFGMIIDNSLIVVEKLSAITKDKNYKANVLMAVNEILVPVKVSTYTTVGAILPIYIMDEILKITLLPFVIAVTFSLISSLIIAILFLPMLVKEAKVKHKEVESRIIAPFILWLGKKKKTSLLILIMLIGLPGIPFYYFPFPNQIEGNDIYNTVFNNDLFKNKIKPTLNYSFGGAIYVYINDLKDKFSWGGSNTLTDDEQHSLSLGIRPPSGTKLEDINAIMVNFEQAIKPYVKNVDHVYVNVSAFYAEMQVYFTDDQYNSNTPEEIKNALAQQTVNFGGLDLSISGVGDAIFIRGAGFGGGPMGEGAISYELKGPSYDEIKRTSEKIKAYLETKKRVFNINITSDAWRNQTQAQMLMNYRTNLEPYERNWINTDLSSLLAKDEEEMRVAGLHGDERLYIKSEGQSIESIGTFNSMVQLNDSSIPIKISNLASIKEEQIQGEIERKNQIYIRPLSFEYRASKNKITEFKKSFEEWIKLNIPDDIKMTKVDNNENFGFAQGVNSNIIVLITLLIIFTIIAMFFESLRYSFAVFAIVPFSLVGIIYFFFFMDQSLDSDALFGLLFVAGIVVNNAAFVIYEIMRKRETGMSHNLSVELTIKDRTRPILLTTITTIVGILPLFIPQILMQVLPLEWIAWLSVNLPTFLNDFLLKNSNTDNMWYSMSLSTISGVTASFFFSLWIPMVLFWKKEK